MKKNPVIFAAAMLVFAFLFFPLFIIVATSFGTAAAIQFSIKGFTLDWYGVVLASDSFMKSFRVSLFVGVGATLLAILLGVPAAYGLARFPSKWTRNLNGFFLSPTLIPGMVVGYMLFQFLLVRLRLPVYAGLLLGYLLISLPYAIRLVGASLQYFDIAMEEASWTLGNTRIKTFFSVVLPNIRSGIFAAFMMSFINSFNNIPVSMFLTGPEVSTLPISILSYMEYNYNPAVSAISTLLMILTILLMLGIEKTLGLSGVL